MYPISPATSPTGRPRSNSYTSSVKEFQVGTKVLIIETENVIQRARHLIGKIGTISEVPVHPATWFKVEFPDHPVVTFRPSAFKILSMDQEFDVLDLPGNYSVRSTPKSKLSPLIKMKHKLKGFHSKSSPKVRGDGKIMNFHEIYGEEDEENDDDNNNTNSNNTDHGDSNTDGNGNHSTTTTTTNTMMMGGHSILHQTDMQSTNEIHSTIQLSTGITPIPEAKHKPLILDTLDPEVWIGCTVKVIGGKNHLEEGKIMRTGNGWVQIVTTGGEEVAKRAHELEVLTLPAGITRPSNYSRTSNNLARRKSNHSNTTASNSYEDERPRPRRLMKRSVDGESLVGTSSSTGEGTADDASRVSETKDFYYWTKELKKSIHIEENYTCYGTSSISQSQEICKQCLAEKWPGSKLCWNEDCITSPIYAKYLYDHYSSDVTKANSTNTTNTNVIIPKSVDTKDLPSPTQIFKLGDSPTSTSPRTATIPIYQSNTTTEQLLDQINNGVKKRRSDSSLTDQESPSPELTAIKENTILQSGMMLPTNPSMPVLVYDDKGHAITYCYPYSSTLHPTTMTNQAQVIYAPMLTSHTRNLSIDVGAAEDSKLLTAMYNASVSPIDPRK